MFDMWIRHRACVLMPLTLLLVGCAAPSRVVAQPDTPRVRNVVFILSDDHRYDFMGFHPKGPTWLETPNLDRMAREGVQLANAFVTTSLCSPSRASILTGRYMHRHRVVDNQRPVAPGTVFFPQLLQKAGVRTAYVGKWHMGHDHDEPRPGFDHWVSFKGQGVYTDPMLNINGQRQQFTGYNADVLTDQAIKWLRDDRGGAADDKPFFLYLAYKAVHYPFQPAPRHKGRYKDKVIDYPETMARTERNYQTQPHWVKQRRYSIHGIDHMETGPFDKDPVPNFDNLYHSYAEAVHSLDQNIGRVLDELTRSGLAKDTLVIYMGDNGFHLGEHGFYDKRDAFETSIRVPMLAWQGGRALVANRNDAAAKDDDTNSKVGARVDRMLLNIDIAPTILDAMGVKPDNDPDFDGQSFWPMLQGKSIPWRSHFVYEYHWEWNFPATPTLFAIRTDRYKYVYYHGAWDHNSFHDLQTDPIERHNLINVPGYRDTIAKMRTQLFEELTQRGALNVPVRMPRGDRLDQRKLP